MAAEEMRRYMYGSVIIVTLPCSIPIPGYMSIKRIAYEEGNPEGCLGWGETDEDAIKHFVTISDA